MGKHWAVIIGINQYQALQPLMYAQLDAIELRDFFTEEAGIPTEQCALLTDVSPIFHESAAYPARESLEQKLREICQQQLAPGDTLWVFFSGYGVSWEGQDFLLLIDADPAHIPNSALSLEAILKQLAAAPTQNLVVVLDMNRSQSALPNQRLGVQTLELAKSLGIPLVLSCRPEQFSQEALAIRHGIFTTALLEGMRYHGHLVLSQLVGYLEERVPELCQLYARPVQNPIAAIPPEKKYLLLLPPESVAHLPMTEAAEAFSLAQASAQAGPFASATFAQTAPTHPAVDPLTTSAKSSAVSARPTSANATPSSKTALEEGDTPAWQTWGIVAAGLLLLGVLIRNQDLFLSRLAPQPTASTPAPTATGTAPPQDPGALAIEQGHKALAERRYGEALVWLTQVPKQERPEDYGPLLDQAQAGYQQSGADSQAVLNSARSSLRPVSPSFFLDAIKRARQIPTGDPYYPQAQQDITRWSQLILDLADGRAATGSLDDAIATAQLVPNDSGEPYLVAQGRIARWQQQKINRDVLKQSQASLLPDQPNTFEDAIKRVRDIPKGYPEYPTAQERIAQWSQDILVIARARAAEGRLQDAISAAQRVPQETSAYEQAQQEITTWQSQL